MFESEEAQGWDYHPLRDICLRDGQYGISEPASVQPIGTPVLRMGNLQDGRISWEDLKYIELPASEKEKYLLQPGNIIFNRTNSAELVGKAAVFDQQQDAIFLLHILYVFKSIPHLLIHSLSVRISTHLLGEFISKRI